mgnify:CR=1 FL=1
MTQTRARAGAAPLYLRRAARAEAALQQAGLGQLDWIGPEWILWLSELDTEVVRFLAARVRGDAALRMAIRRCTAPCDRRRLQVDALREGLVACAERQGRDLSGALRFLRGCDHAPNPAEA